MREEREQAEQGDEVQKIFFDLCAIRSGSEWIVRKTTPVRMMDATTNTSVTLKSTSVLPGAVMKNGRCVSRSD